MRLAGERKNSGGLIPSVLDTLHTSSSISKMCIVIASMDQCHIHMCRRIVIWTSDVTYVCRGLRCCYLEFSNSSWQIAQVLSPTLQFKVQGLDRHFNLQKRTVRVGRSEVEVEVCVHQKRKSIA